VVIRQWIDSGRIAPIDPLLFQMNMWAVTQHYAEYEAQARILMDQPADAPLDADRIVAEATQLFLRRCGLLVDEDEKQ
jgi:TetR/AcrR family transcriptional regulator